MGVRTHLIQTIALAALAAGSTSVSAGTQHLGAADRLPALTAGERPFHYSASEIGSQRARSTVANEAVMALADGDIANGQAPPDRSGHVESVKTRKQVDAEARTAMQLAVLPQGQLAPVITPSERAEIRTAGLEARLMAG
jgi:hypothetical protein